MRKNLRLFSGLSLSLLGAAGPAAALAPQLFAPGVVSTGFDESHPAFAPDGNTLYFLRNAPDFGHWIILQAQRRGDSWADIKVAPFSGRWNEGDVFVTRDNKRLFFISDRPVDRGQRTDTEIWMLPRKGEGWGAPRHIKALSSPANEWHPTFADNGAVYFGSERAGGRGGSDIWRARWAGDHFEAPENLGPMINGKGPEIEPLIARDESWMIFAGKIEGRSVGGYDLYISYNCPTGWSAPELLPADINSTAWDFAPAMSPDGNAFLFASNRSGWRTPGKPLTLKALEARLSAPQNGLRDIYAVPAAALPLTRKCDG